MKSFYLDYQNAPFFAGKIGAWIKERVESAHCKGVVFGMSGGIDCSVAARLCQMGGVDVHLVLMPYGDDMMKTKSNDHAMELIEKFNFPYHVFDIKPAVDALTIPEDAPFIKNGDAAAKNAIRISRANIRPRARMTYLYQFAQLDNRLVLGTSNLAELTMGYFTKWGDGACDLLPIALLAKQEVYALAKYLEIPASIINKEPSAELWEGQTDEEEMGMEYWQIDRFIIIGSTGKPEINRKIRDRMAMSAHKLDPIPFYDGISFDIPNENLKPKLTHFIRHNGVVDLGEYGKLWAGGRKDI